MWLITQNVKAIARGLIKVVGELIIEIYHSDRQHRKSREFIIVLVEV
ncbi:MAG: hypothetical protein RMY33_035135 [Nostoc sp. DedQUE03]